MSPTTAKDIHQMPLYSATEAAQFLRLPASTVRAWSFGQTYSGKRGESHRFASVIDPADRMERRLSFVNLIELSVLAAVRRVHRVRLTQVRDAVKFLRKHFPTPHPLADHRFQTDGCDLLVEKFGRLLNISRDGQVEMRELIARSLSDVERDATGIPTKLHLPSSKSADAKRSGLVIDPVRGFGRPIIDRSGVRAEIVLQRFRAGDTIEGLADDYDLDEGFVEELIRNELPRAA